MNSLDYTSYDDPCIKYPIYDFELSFENYIAECRTIVSKYRIDLNQSSNPESIIDANSPYELKPTKESNVGALLIHGLFDSPFIMKDIANKLSSQNLLIRSILLPGHGTVPGGLLNVSYKDWIQALLYGINSLSKVVEKIILIGFSTGASLALHHLFQNMHPKIAGVILLAPAIEISRFGPISWIPPKFNFLSKRFNWICLSEENDYVKYKSFTYNSAYQVYLLTQEIKKLSETHFLKCPLFICISEDDKTTLSKATLYHFRNYSSKQSRLLLYTNNPNNFQDTRIIKRPATCEKWRINNISHIAIPISPENPHYGMYGDYSEASRVEDNLKCNGKITYGTLNGLTENCLNKLCNAKLFPHFYSRLTFNPDFDFLVDSLGNFIKKLTSS